MEKLELSQNAASIKKSSSGSCAAFCVAGILFKTCVIFTVFDYFLKKALEMVSVKEELLYCALS